MEFLILTCRHCGDPVTFDTANDLAEHHLGLHERLTRRDGSLLVPMRSDDVIGRATETPGRLWVDVRTLTLPKNGVTNTRRPGAH